MHFLLIIRPQIQLPDPLYREVRRIAAQQQWSVTEVIRRGAETMIRLYPAGKAAHTSTALPPALGARLRVTAPAKLKDLIRADAEARP